MNVLTVRMDLQEVGITEVEKVLSLKATKWIYSIEKVETNPHCHWLIYTEESIQNLRVRIKKLNISGNKCYSISKCKNEIKYIAYIIKDCVDGGYAEQNVPEEVLVEATALCLLPRLLGEVSKAKKPSIIEFLRNECEGITDPHKIISTIYTYMCDNDYLIRQGMLESYALTILCKNNPQFRDLQITKMYKRLMELK